MIFMYLFIIRIYVSRISLTDLFSSEILGICYQGTGHHLCMGGGGEGKRRGEGGQGYFRLARAGVKLFYKEV